MKPAFAYDRWLALMVMIATLQSGCGSGDPFDYVQVSGRVTYDDGSLIPAEQLMVKFTPETDAVDARTHPRPGLAVVNVADGSFDCFTSHRPGDGVVRGKHRVRIVALDAGEKLSPLIPPEYSSDSQSPLVVDTADSPFLFQIPKPKPDA